MEQKANFTQMVRVLVSLAWVLIAAGVLALASLRTAEFLKLKKTGIKNQAVTECFQIAGYHQEKVDDKVTVSWPLQDIYKYCLLDKGYETSWK